MTEKRKALRLKKSIVERISKLAEEKDTSPVEIILDAISQMASV